MIRHSHQVRASVRVGRGKLSIDLELSEPEPWMLEGLCAQVDPDLWFPEKGGTTGDAKRICMKCPVRADCLEYALAHDERFGIWGGLSERERRALKPIGPDANERIAAVQLLAAEGLSDRAISIELGISSSTAWMDRRRPQVVSLGEAS